MQLKHVMDSFGYTTKNIFWVKEWLICFVTHFEVSVARWCDNVIVEHPFPEGCVLDTSPFISRGDQVVAVAGISPDPVVAKAADKLHAGNFTKQDIV